MHKVCLKYDKIHIKFLQVYYDSSVLLNWGTESQNSMGIIEMDWCNMNVYTVHQLCALILGSTCQVEDPDKFQIWHTKWLEGFPLGISFLPRTLFGYKLECIQGDFFLYAHDDVTASLKGFNQKTTVRQKYRSQLLVIAQVMINQSEWRQFRTDCGMFNGYEGERRLLEKLHLEICLKIFKAC